MENGGLPSGKRLHSYGKSPFFMGKSTNSMAIFSSYVKLPAGLEMGRVKTAFSCDWQEVNHAFRSVFSCFYVVHEGQFYCDFEFSLGFTVYS